MAKIVKIDFYQLSSKNKQERDLFLCKLIEKVYLRKHKLYVHCEDQKEAELLDELLWTYKDTSFIPHNLIDEGPNEPPPIQLGYKNPPSHGDVLINLSNQVPEFHSRFKRVLEVFSSSDSSNQNKAIYQEHLKIYQQQNFEVTTHTINQEKKASSHG